MFGVIALHATMPYVIPGKTGLADIVYDTGVISIPLFFMVTGFLLLPRNNISIVSSLKKILGFIRFIVTIVFIGWLCYSIVFGFSWDTLIRWLTGTFTTHGPFGVFWYLWAICICYLLLPLLNYLFICKPNTYISLFLVLWLFCICIFSYTLQGGKWELQVPAVLRVWNSILYFMLGGLLSRVNYKVPLWLPIVMYLATLCYIEYFGKPINNEYASTFYCSVPVTVLCTSLFIYLKNKTIENNRIIATLSTLFLPVYATHNVIIVFFPHFYDTIPIIAPLVNLIVVSILSVAMSYVIIKVPYINKLFRV
jgi:surface polysaccharide O-acyltransferase-like enzyme